MRVRRQHVVIPPDLETKLVEVLFNQTVPRGIIVRENPLTIVHHHSYGGLSPFFEGLTQGILQGTFCNCPEATGIWLPPRVHCPD